MSTISTANSNANDALLSLLRQSSQSDVGRSGTVSSSQSSSASRTPVDTVDLSDRAQAILARAKVEQAAADKLAAQRSSADGNRKGNSSASPNGFAALSDHLQKLINDHRRPDGTVSNFTETVNDVFNAPPSTPQEINDWYKNEEARAAQAAADEPDSTLKTQAEAYLQAVRDRQVTVVSAQDIPDLNFHNTTILQGGETGASMNGSFTYNHNASIFKDPSKTYYVGSDGTLVMWNHAAAQS
ncbi:MULTISPECIES: hypothetical protein [unclassified Bradyrhizobium]|uniref:hypothetical protein n=1 Tax=unclassified Bradyrhizobium TaxID=2631580 RepID=UPI0024B122A3|nr:hypothetical protein [Bradyrhizobium sp. CB2312]WFU68628.1 hypothetical protein QA642_25210 [Bradyrhizobium sp. CB2312]